MRTRTSTALLVPLLVPGCITERYIDMKIEAWSMSMPEEESTGSSSSGSGESSTTEMEREETSGTASTTESGEQGAEGASEGSTGAVSGSSSTGETTGGAAVCGDGVVEGEEECDDRNTLEDDGCRSDCLKEWYVFITSPVNGGGFQGDEVMGIIGADYQCRHRATKMFLPNGDRYKAWISTSETQPVDRLYHARGPYKLVNGLQVAANWDALVSGQLEHAIDVTEMSETLSEFGVWTGTRADGTRAEGTTHCDDWTDNDFDNTGVFGGSDYTDAFWTDATTEVCAGALFLYCFEQP